jgi:hypothetical protein
LVVQPASSQAGSPGPACVAAGNAITMPARIIAWLPSSEARIRAAGGLATQAALQPGGPAPPGFLRPALTPLPDRRPDVDVTRLLEFAARLAELGEQLERVLDTPEPASEPRGRFVCPECGLDQMSDEVRQRTEGLTDESCGRRSCRPKR